MLSPSVKADHTSVHALPKIKAQYESGSYEYIVIGSGMGGGMVARQLIQKDKKVLLIERGTLNLQTHCLNLSRPHFNPRSQEGPGRDNEVFFNRVKKNYNKHEGDSSDCKGGSVFALGGKSLYWSLEIPRIVQSSARDKFPPNIVSYLYGTKPKTGDMGVYENKDDNTIEAGYTKSLRVMANSPPGNQNYPDDQYAAQSDIVKAKSKLNTAVSEYICSPDSATTVRNGAEFAEAGELYYFPQKAYSTVDYLLDQQLIKDSRLKIWTKNNVVSFGKSKGKVTKLNIRDADDEPWRLHVHKAKVILCAGTVNTAAIALRSKLDEEKPLVGKGLTDHEIWMVRYWKETKSSDAEEQPVELSCYVKIHGHMALLTICIHAERFFRHGFATGEADYTDDVSNVNVLNIMLEFEADLNEKGKVECESERSEPVVTINRQRLDSDPEFSKAINDLAAEIRHAFDFPSTDQNQETPRLAGWGAVAHEVGTMRMDTPHRTGVVDENLKVHGYDNLYVCDLSIFPFSPMANPSLTLTALAMRLGDHFSKSKSKYLQSGNEQGESEQSNSKRGVFLLI